VDEITRQLSASVVKFIQSKNLQISTSNRDLATGLPFVDEQWIGANFTPAEQRDDAQKAILGLSDTLVEELQQAEYIVIGAPIYNFSIPAVLKAWIDMIARVGLTFRYTENGAEGLLNDKKVYLVIASGGVPIGSDMEFSSHYLKHVFGFMGISEVTVIDASKFDLANVGDVSKQLEALKI